MIRDHELLVSFRSDDKTAEAVQAMVRIVLSVFFKAEGAAPSAPSNAEQSPPPDKEKESCDSE